MEYNTNREKLRLPEFGRHIQKMVNYCLTIEDRNERQVCAESIVSILMRLFPEEMSASESTNSKAWDTMQILSDFKLDIDYPCSVIADDNYKPKPELIPYNIANPRMRTYGRVIENMANAVADMPDDENKEEAVWRVAMQMKKVLFEHNPEAADDNIVLRDLANMTNNKIKLNPEVYRLRDFMLSSENGDSNSKSKKKKKKK